MRDGDDGKGLPSLLRFISSFSLGQSNMEWPMISIYNATEEIAASAPYTNIRMYKVRKSEENVGQRPNEKDDNEVIEN